MCQARQDRGLAIAAVCKIVQKGKAYIVPSQSGKGAYTVLPDEQSPYCSCPDFETRGIDSKHIIATRIVIKREQNGDGTETITKSTTVTETVKRPTYGQDWPAYNLAQTNEKRHFQVLLRDLVQCVEEPARKATGRQPMSLRAAIFAAVFKVYSTVSGRRFMVDMHESHANGFVTQCPSYNSIFKCLEAESLTKILTDLIIKSSIPLQSLETDFAVDSSGFSGSKFVRWFDYKYNAVRQEHQWVKCHLCCGVKTHVVAAVEITEKHVNDSPMMPHLLQTTSRNFTINEVSADKQYASVENIDNIVALGADP